MISGSFGVVDPANRGAAETSGFAAEGGSMFAEPPFGESGSTADDIQRTLCQAYWLSPWQNGSDSGMAGRHDLF